MCAGYIYTHNRRSTLHLCACLCVLACVCIAPKQMFISREVLRTLETKFGLARRHRDWDLGGCLWHFGGCVVGAKAKGVQERQADEQLLLTLLLEILIIAIRIIGGGGGVCARSGGGQRNTSSHWSAGHAETTKTDPQWRARSLIRNSATP